MLLASVRLLLESLYIPPPEVAELPLKVTFVSVELQYALYIPPPTRGAGWDVAWGWRPSANLQRVHSLALWPCTRSAAQIVSEREQRCRVDLGCTGYSFELHYVK
jgi:hypothetical protein